MLSSAILMILNINLAMQVTIPTTISCFQGYALENSLGITPSDMLRVVSLHAFYLLCFLFVFLSKEYAYCLKGPNASKKLNKTKVPGLEHHARQHRGMAFDLRAFAFILIGVYLLIINFQLAGMYQTLDEIAGLIKKDYTFFDITNIYLQTMFEWTSIVAAVFFLTCYKGARTLKVVVGLFCILFLVRQLALGLRGGMFFLFILFLFFSYLSSTKVRLIYFLVVFFLVFPLFSYLGGDYREKLSEGLFQMGTFERIVLIMHDIITPDSDIANKVEDNLTSIYNRLETTRNSVSLVNLYNEGRGASFRPTLSSILAFVPGWMWPSKLYPTSSTGEVFGTAMYVVRSMTYQTTDMGPYLSSAHEYWQGGVIYLILSGFFSGWIWRFLVEWSNRTGLSTASLLILTCFFDAHHGEMSITAPIALTIRLFWYQILPTIIIMYCIGLLHSKRITLRLNDQPLNRAIPHRTN